MNLVYPVFLMIAYARLAAMIHGYIHNESESRLFVHQLPNPSSLSAVGVAI